MSSNTCNHTQDGQGNNDVNDDNGVGGGGGGSNNTVKREEKNNFVNETTMSKFFTITVWPGSITDGPVIESNRLACHLAVHTHTHKCMHAHTHTTTNTTQNTHSTHHIQQNTTHTHDCWKPKHHLSWSSIELVEACFFFAMGFTDMERWTKEE